MEVCVRKESNGSIYLDKTALSRFSREELQKEPYNYTFVEVPFDDIQGSDFNDDLTFNLTKYNTRKTNESNTAQINELKAKLRQYDYIGVKIATGCATKEEYSNEIAQCELWRQQIRKLGG